ncbi:SPW repeat protein [Mesorhizobium tianshanense]|uniref:SPW repeat-containing protein n=1 Tax=Mesorhizobium tianshanense TaxID=39844 RepID=A0A562MCL7_9HYPH|nr:SPW repeat protein [Mesorhizobium tianshanense]TWI17291.1 SPW repeat-containing protein [Mesorhizobium tianshanense]
MNEQRWQDWVTMLVGVYVFLSPWIIPYFFPGSTVMPVIGWSHYIVGFAIAVMGMAALASFQLWQEWLILILGLWLIISPWVFGFTDTTPFHWNSVSTGIIVVIFSATALVSGFDTRNIT